MQDPNLTPGKESRYPLNGRLGESQSCSEHFGGQKNLLPLQGFEPRIVQPVAYSLRLPVIRPCSPYILCMLTF